MKSFLLSGVIGFAIVASGAASASELESSEIQILSVIPRSADVKPAIMVVPAIRHQTSGSVNPAGGSTPNRRAGAPAGDRGSEQVASADSRKAGALAPDGKQ